MIGQLIKLLQSDEYYGVSKNIEIAKGKYKKPESLKEILKQSKRDIKWQLRRQS